MINSLNSQDLKSSSFDQIFKTDAYICVEIDYVFMQPPLSVGLDLQ